MVPYMTQAIDPVGACTELSDTMVSLQSCMLEMKGWRLEGREGEETQ